MRWAFLLVALLVGGYNALVPAARVTLETPLLMTIHQTVGMAPLTLRIKVKAVAEGREVCVVVDGPESMQSCRTLQGITWTQDFTLRSGGCYEAYATSQGYRTPAVRINVVGMNGEACDGQ